MKTRSYFVLLLLVFAFSLSSQVLAQREQPKGLVGITLSEEKGEAGLVCETLEQKDGASTIACPKIKPQKYKLNIELPQYSKFLIGISHGNFAVKTGKRLEGSFTGLKSWRDVDGLYIFAGGQDSSQIFTVEWARTPELEGKEITIAVFELEMKGGSPRLVRSGVWTSSPKTWEQAKEKASEVYTIRFY